MVCVFSKASTTVGLKHHTKVTSSLYTNAPANSGLNSSPVTWTAY